MFRPARGWTWWIRIAVTFFAASGVLQIVGVVLYPADRPAWQWLLVPGGAVVTLATAGRAWLLAGGLHRAVWDCPEFAQPRGGYREARRALRNGAALTERQRRLVAFEVGQLPAFRAGLVAYTAQFGSQVLGWSARTGPGTFFAVSAVLLAVQLLVLGGGAVLLWRGRRLRDAAARIGALPLRNTA